MEQANGKLHLTDIEKFCNNQKVKPENLLLWLQCDDVESLERFYCAVIHIKRSFMLHRTGPSRWKLECCAVSTKYVYIFIVIYSSQLRL